MWPLLLLSLLSILIILERLVFFLSNTYKFTPTLQKGVEANEVINNPLGKVISVYKNGVSLGEEHCLNVGTREASRQISAHERGLKLLATIGAISPLIGLLGTVWGMVKAFSKMAEMGDKVTPADFADGIWTGLLTTVAGLLVAIPAVVGSRMFEAKVDRLCNDLNQLSSHLKEKFFPSKG